ncbi:MAG: nucleoside monophosphate kinase [Patescibacteria group bacterium]|nr:nucleoside monophosphate kinase [Patescibacteria group bacterium]
MEFPIHKTKIAGVERKFNLSDPVERKEYFAAKAGPEIEKLKKYLGTQTFIGYLLGKKNTGKGTYSKMFAEVVGEGHIGHVAVGDIVRDVHKSFEQKSGEHEKLLTFIKNNYRGFHSVEETVDLILGRSQSGLVSSELIVALVKYEISRRQKKAIFIDGFPRAHDQIGYSLYLKELIGYRDDPDFFVFISVPNSIIDERIKYRVVCPICRVPRNLKLLATKDVGWDEAKKEFYLMCDNPSCGSARMLPKEGDELGIEPIRKRLEIDQQIFDKLLQLTGVPKVYLRNAIPVALAKDSVDDYELTPAYSYELDKATGKVVTKEAPWVVKDDEGVDSYSLLPPAVVVSFLKQAVKVLGL